MSPMLDSLTGVELVVGILASLIGTTGVIGIITAGVQLSVRARIRRAIAALKEASENVAPGSHTRQMLQQAIETDTLRLAAMSVITLRARTKYFLSAVIFGLVLSVVMAVSAQSAGIDVTSFTPPIERTPQSRAFAFFLLTLILTYLVVGLLVLNLHLQRDRERFVAEALLKSNAPFRTRAMTQAKRDSGATRRAYAKSRAQNVRRIAKAEQKAKKRNIGIPTS